MNWETFYFVCFAVGFVMSLVSFLSGAMHLHLPIKLHFGHGWLHGAGHGGGGGGMSFLNGFTLTVFVAWFGAAGYLLTRHTGVLPMLGLMMSVGAGTVGALIVFGFLVKVLLPHDKAIDQADYEMVGVLGRVNTSIRAGGTGELIFTLAGTRRSCGARTEDGLALPKGAEVIVTRFEKGIAYVKTWDELAGELHSSGQSGANV